MLPQATFARTPAPTQAPAPAPTRAPVVAAPTVAPTPKPTATSGAPQLYSVSASPAVAHAGDAVLFDARVSPSVVSVSARVAVYSFALYRTSAGHFGETFKIPKDVPPLFHGHYSLTITATSANGETTSRSLPLSFL